MVEYKEDNILITLNDLLIQKINIKLDEEIKTIINNKLRKLLVKNKINDRKKVFCLLRSLRTCEFLRGDNIKRLLELSDIPVELAEKHIISVRRGHCGHNKPLQIKLPIKATKELSLLIGKTIGDGGISSDLRFHYTNNEHELVKEVMFCVKKTIGESYYRLVWERRKIYELRFPSIVGFILSLVGSPIGHKVKQSFDIPVWILVGN